MLPELIRLARATNGFMADDEGNALYRTVLRVGRERGQSVEGERGQSVEGEAAAQSVGPDSIPAAVTIVEIGSYCGKSTVYLGAAAAEVGAVVFTVDHHRGSEEMQTGWEYHDAELVDPATGRIDSLRSLRATLEAARLEEVVVAVVGYSATVAAHWDSPVDMVFIDGGHGTGPAHTDYECWMPKLVGGGTLAIHDVFENPADGGRPPYEVYLRALKDGFVESDRVGSLRVLQVPL